MDVLCPYPYGMHVRSAWQEGTRKSWTSSGVLSDGKRRFNATTCTQSFVVVKSEEMEDFEHVWNTLKNTKGNARGWY